MDVFNLFNASTLHIALTLVCLSLGCSILLRPPGNRRFTLASLLIPFGFAAFKTARYLPMHDALSYIYHHFIILWLTHILIISRLPEHQVYFASITGGQEPWIFARKMLFNGRWIGTKYAERRVLTRHNHKETSSTPRISRREFCIRQLLITTTCFVANIIYHRLLLSVTWSRADFSSEKQTYVRRILSGDVTFRETTIRIWTSFNFVFVNYSALTGLHAALSVLFVGVLIVDTPDEWPPLFGRLRDANSIHGFWAMFWHQLTYRPYVFVGKFVVLDVFKLSNESIAAGWAIKFGVFLLSGLAHCLVSWQIGCRCGLLEEVLWFCGNFIALFAEKSMFLLLQQCVCLESRICKSLGNLVGYVWVVSFLCWSLPKVHYPRYICQQR